MSADRVVYSCTVPFVGKAAEGRFKDASVQFNQLLLEGDPIIDATPKYWERVGTVDTVTARVIEGLGPRAKLPDWVTRLGPLLPEGTIGSNVSPANAPSATRRRGRPKGTRTVPRDQIVDTFRALRANYGRNPEQSELADALKPRIAVRTLQDHLADYGLPWPIE